MKQHLYGFSTFYQTTVKSNSTESRHSSKKVFLNSKGNFTPAQKPS